nr:hypothetical protein [Campylobacter sp.]
MKKFGFVLCISLILANFALAFDLGGIINKNKDKIWGKIGERTSGITGVCYNPSDTSIDSLDPCDQLSQINTNVCSFAPDLPGFNKKNRSVGLDGLRQFCKAKDREFEDVTSTTAENTAGNVWDEVNGDFQDKNMPNGQKYSEYLKVWDINQALKKDGDKPNLVRDYVLNRREAELGVLMSYHASASSKGKNINQIKVDDIKAPANLYSYKKGVFELASSNSMNLKDTSPSNIGSAISLQLLNTTDDEAQDISQNHLQKMKNSFNNAKANEIGLALELAKKPDDITIPTQEYINILRSDKKIQAIAQIRKQQLREAQIISEINAKWDKREILARLVADKEVIMAQQFDEEEAKNKINSIVNSVQ